MGQMLPMASLDLSRSEDVAASRLFSDDALLQSTMSIELARQASDAQNTCHHPYMLSQSVLPGPG